MSCGKFNKDCVSATRTGTVQQPEGKTAHTVAERLTAIPRTSEEAYKP